MFFQPLDQTLRAALLFDKRRLTFSLVGSIRVQVRSMGFKQQSDWRRFSATVILRSSRVSSASISA